MRGLRARLERAVSVLALALLGASCAPAGEPGDTAPAPASPSTTATTAAPDAPATTAVPAVEVLGATVVAPATVPTPDVTPPTTVMIVGDSGMVDLSPALEASFTAAGVTRVVNDAWPGFGLTRPQFAWREEWTRAVAQERPDVVVVMLGGWDEAFAEQHGLRAYGAIVDEALAILTAHGARVEWLATPPGGTTYRPVVNAVFAGLRQRPGAVDFFDASGPLRRSDGSVLRTVSTLAGELLVRKPDHWHFCPDGALLVAAAVHAHLTELGWMPPAAPGWERGRWRARADLYDNPPGACDPVA